MALYSPPSVTRPILFRRACREPLCRHWEKLVAMSDISGPAVHRPNYEANSRAADKASLEVVMPGRRIHNPV